MERDSRKRSSNAGSEKMERVGGRQVKMEGHCLTGQSPKWAVVPMEEEKQPRYYVYSPMRKPESNNLMDGSSWKICYIFFLNLFHSMPHYTVILHALHNLRFN